MEEVELYSLNERTREEFRFSLKKFLDETRKKKTNEFENKILEKRIDRLIEFFQQLDLTLDREEICRIFSIELCFSSIDVEPKVYRENSLPSSIVRSLKETIPGNELSQIENQFRSKKTKTQILPSKKERIQETVRGFALEFHFL